MGQPGIFIISLDFELHWGCFESMSLTETQQQYFYNTRKVIPQKLQLFADEQVHVTWATVGMLYRNNKREWEDNHPAILPSFRNQAVSAYEWINQHGFFSEEDPFHFAPGLVDLIRATPYQEIGTHTYAHYYCLEDGQTPEQFREDLRMACNVAKANGTIIRSLVFPRNQFNGNYLSICAEMGISSVRSNPDIWYWKPGTQASFLKKIFRSGDAYLNIQPAPKILLNNIKIHKGLPLLLPASRLYRPWKPRFQLQNKLKLRRILNEMTMAAKQKACYHLWWHPHNFGNHPQECMNELRQIIQHYKMLNKREGFQSMSMGEVSSLLLNNDGNFKDQ